MAYEDAQPSQSGNRTAFRAAEKQFRLQRAHRCLCDLLRPPPPGRTHTKTFQRMDRRHHEPAHTATQRTQRAPQFSFENTCRVKSGSKKLRPAAEAETDLLREVCDFTARADGIADFALEACAARGVGVSCSCAWPGQRIYNVDKPPRRAACVTQGL